MEKIIEFKCRLCENSTGSTRYVYCKKCRLKRLRKRNEKKWEEQKKNMEEILKKNI